MPLSTRTARQNAVGLLGNAVRQSPCAEHRSWYMPLGLTLAPLKAAKDTDTSSPPPHTHNQTALNIRYATSRHTPGTTDCHAPASPLQASMHTKKDGILLRPKTQRSWRESRPLSPAVAAEPLPNQPSRSQCTSSSLPSTKPPPSRAQAPCPVSTAPRRLNKNDGQNTTGQADAERAL